MSSATRGLVVPGLLAGADLSADQHKIVKLDGNGDVVLCGAGESMTGVLEDAPEAAGRAASVVTTNRTKVRASAGITAGDRLGCAAGGLARTAASNDWILGEALSDAAAGDIFSALLSLQGQEP